MTTEACMERETQPDVVILMEEYSPVRRVVPQSAAAGEAIRPCLPKHAWWTPDGYIAGPGDVATVLKALIGRRLNIRVLVYGYLVGECDELDVRRN